MKVTVWVVFAGTFTVWLTVMSGLVPPGAVMATVTVPLCALAE